jgi:cytochrome oxidase Cu insertion factor (SCO1/SenC/PrrC family)
VTAPGSRHAFWWVLALFATPLLLSFVLYYGSGWRPAGHTNHGELIAPPRPLPSIALPMPGGQRADAGVLQGKWSLVYVGSGACDESCRSALYFLQQTHLSLGNLMPRVQRLFLASRDCCSGTPQAAGLITLDATGAEAADLRSAFPSGTATTVYVVDPRGNLMMRYDARADPKGLREDLKKLLNLSHIG